MEITSVVYRTLRGGRLKEKTQGEKPSVYIFTLCREIKEGKVIFAYPGSEVFPVYLRVPWP